MLRAAAGRKPGLFRVPPALLATALGMIGKRDCFERLAGTLVVDAVTSCSPPAGSRVADTETAIAEMVQAASPRKSGTASRSTP